VEGDFRSGYEVAKKYSSAAKRFGFWSYIACDIDEFYSFVPEH
jgi:hypothetical protein